MATLLCKRLHSRAATVLGVYWLGILAVKPKLEIEIQAFVNLVAFFVTYY